MSGVVAASGAPVTVVARNPSNLDLFVTGADGLIYATWWDAAGGWANWFNVSGIVTAPGAPVTVVARNPDHLDLFVTGADGLVYSTSWDENGGWVNWFNMSGIVATPCAPVTVIARNPDHLDLFVAGADGLIYSTWWDTTGGWANWFNVSGASAAPRTPVTVVARNPDHLDLFVAGADGLIYSTWWDINDVRDPFPSNFELLKTYTDWPKTWSHIVAGKFSKSPYSGLLFYELHEGHAEFCETDGSGGTSFLQSHSGWRKSWSHIVPGFFHGKDFTGLLFYDRQAGFAAIYDTDGKGNLLKLHEYPGWRKSWTHITTIRIPGNEFSAVVLYDQAAGHGEIHKCDGSGGLQLILNRDDWGTSWTHVVGDFFVGNLLLFYAGSTSYGETYAVIYDEDSKASELKRRGKQEKFPAATEIVAGNFGWSETSFLFYDSASGRGTFVLELSDSAPQAIPAPLETYDGWRKTWHIIVPGKFWEADPEHLKFQNGFTDLLFYDRWNGHGEFFLHEPFDSIQSVALEGYVSAGSVTAGENIGFHVNSRVGPFTIKVYRQDLNRILMTTIEGVRQLPQPFPIGRLAYRDGPAWPAAAELTIPQNWPSGLYLASVEALLDEGQVHAVDIPFVVRAANPGSESKILLMIADTTYEAYNFWGGRSLYGFISRGAAHWSYGARHNMPDNHQIPRAFRVALARPYRNDVGLKWQRWEVPLIQWLARQGIAVEVCTATDIHKDHINHTGSLSSYRLLVSVGHDEYWSKEMRDNVESFTARGGNVAFFSGNVCWFQIRFDENCEHQICYKDPRFDPYNNPTQSKLVTGNWDDKPVRRASTSLTGVSYCDRDASMEYLVTKPDHWVFKHTELTKKSPFGTYRDTRGQVSSVLFETETDRYQPFDSDLHNPMSPLNFVTLAVVPVLGSENKEEIETIDTAGTMGIFTHGKGEVFTAATNNWSLGLSQKDSEWTPIDQITRNVFDKFGLP